MHSSTPASIASPMPPGDPVRFDGQGNPTIVRHLDTEIGKARTFVKVESGELRVFGESTIRSLAESLEVDAQTWVDEMSDRELHGLAHELCQRLLSGSEEYRALQ